MDLQPIDERSVPTVRGEWIAHSAGSWVKRPLSQPGNPWGDRRLEVGHLPQRGQYVVGSNRQSDVPDDHGEYGTPLERVRLDIGEHYRLTSIEPAHARLSPTLDFDLLRGPERITGSLQLCRVHLAYFDTPATGFEALGKVRGARFHGIEHIQSGGQRRIEGITDVERFARFGEADLGVLSLTGRPRGR